MIIAVALLIVATGTVANIWWHGMISEEQAVERNKLADWETRLRRSTYGQPLGGCRSLAECNINRADIAHLRGLIAEYERSLAAMEPKRRNP